jgi:phospholipid transport system substrate-binding protein
MKRPSLIDRIIAILLLGGLYFFIARTFVSGSEIEGSLESIISTISALKKAVGNKTEIRRLILERMDMDEMGKRSLGRHWKDLSGTQRKEYLAEFTAYVEAFYRKQVFESVEFINSVDIRYLKERVDGAYAEVDIQIIAQNDKISIIFKLSLNDNRWQAYDVIVENISTVSNLRAQFDRIIEKEKFKGLLRRLREKIKELNK